MFWVNHHPQTDKRRAKPDRDQPGYEIQWFKNDVCGAVAPECFQLIADLASSAWNSGQCS
jgi:hypothetical protein